MHQYSHQETLGLFLPLFKAFGSGISMFLYRLLLFTTWFKFERQVWTSLFLNARVLVLPGCNGRVFLCLRVTPCPMLTCFVWVPAMC